MTVESYAQAPAYTISGVGPYPIPHPYLADTIAAFVLIEDVPTQLDGADYSVDPVTAVDQGNLLLTSASAATHDGRTLWIERATPLEQGWMARDDGREAGMEAQLDQGTMSAQEDRAQIGAALRARKPMAAYDPIANCVPVVRPDGGGFANGPTLTEISTAAQNAIDADLARQAAEAAALKADVHKDDFVALTIATDIIVGQVVRVRDGANGNPEDGITVDPGTYVPDGSLVRDLPGSGLQWVSYRRKYSSFDEFDADTRPLADGTILTCQAIGATWEIVASGEHFTTTGGHKVKAVKSGNGYPVECWGEDAASFKAALSIGDHILVKSGKTYDLTVTSEANTPVFSEGAHLHANGATFKFGMDTGYLPCFSANNLNNFGFHGPVKFVNTGSLDGVESTSTTDVTRLGITAIPRSFNTAIRVNNSYGVIRDIVGEGETTLNQITSYVYCTGGEVLVENISGDDCSCVVIGGGAATGESRLRGVHGGRLNSDNSIPGHVAYVLGGFCEISGITDEGEDTGSGNVSHTVSVKNTDGGTIKGIQSRRGAGIINYQTNNCKISDLSWEDNESGPISTAAIYGNSGANNVVDGFLLKTARDICTVHDVNTGDTIRGKIIRQADSAMTESFLRLTNTGGIADVECVNNGSFAIPTIRAHTNQLRDSRIDVTMSGDVIVPSIDWRGITGCSRNRIRFSTRSDGTILEPPIDISKIRTGVAIDDRTNSYESRSVWLNWVESVTGTPASVSYTAQLPRAGVWLLTLVLQQGNNHGKASAFNAIVTFDDQAADFTDVQQIGAQVDKGGSPFGAISISVANRGLLTVSAALSAALDYDVQLGAKLLNSLT